MCEVVKPPDSKLCLGQIPALPLCVCSVGPKVPSCIQQLLNIICYSSSLWDGAESKNKIAVLMDFTCYGGAGPQKIIKRTSNV